MKIPRLRVATVAALPAAAAAGTPQTEPIVLPPVGITATRGEKPIDQVPATVSIIDDRRMEQMSVIRPSDVVRSEREAAYLSVQVVRLRRSVVPAAALTEANLSVCLGIAMETLHRPNGQAVYVT